MRSTLLLNAGRTRPSPKRQRCSTHSKPPSTSAPIYGTEHIYNTELKYFFKLTSLEVLLLLSSRNCCRVTTSLPGEPVLLRFPRAWGVSGVLDLAWPRRNGLGLPLLLDQASCSCSRLNSPLLWLCGRLGLLAAPAAGFRKKQTGKLLNSTTLLKSGTLSDSLNSDSI